MKEQSFIYPQANRRKCYWLVRDCLKARSPCSKKCPDYLSVAQADRIKKDRLDRIIERDIRNMKG